MNADSSLTDEDMPDKNIIQTEMPPNIKFIFKGSNKEWQIYSKGDKTLGKHTNLTKQHTHFVLIKTPEYTNENLPPLPGSPPPIPTAPKPGQPRLTLEKTHGSLLDPSGQSGGARKTKKSTNKSKYRKTKKVKRSQKTKKGNKSKAKKTKHSKKSRSHKRK
jgi:hypothetical protein